LQHNFAWLSFWHFPASHFFKYWVMTVQRIYQLSGTWWQAWSDQLQLLDVIGTWEGFCHKH
jgi:hypothetical protein